MRAHFFRKEFLMPLLSEREKLIDSKTQNGQVRAQNLSSLPHPRFLSFLSFLSFQMFFPSSYSSPPLRSAEEYKSLAVFDALLAPAYTLQFHSYGRRVYDLTAEVKELIDQCARSSLTYDQTVTASRGKGYWFQGFIEFVFEKSQELVAAGLPEKESPAWERIVANYTEDEWVAKEAVRRAAHEKVQTEALWECIARAVEFAAMDPYRMATYLAERPNPHRWGNLTALVDRRILGRVEEWAEDIRQAQIDREDYLSHVYDD
jgi:hypothetical protein